MRAFCLRQLVELRKKLNTCVNGLRRRPGLVRSYFRASYISIGEGAERKLLKYCNLEEVTKLCVYQ